MSFRAPSDAEMWGVFFDHKSKIQASCGWVKFENRTPKQSNPRNCEWDITAPGCPTTVWLGIGPTNRFAVKALDPSGQASDERELITFLSEAVTDMVIDYIKTHLPAPPGWLDDGEAAFMQRRRARLAPRTATDPKTAKAMKRYLDRVMARKTTEPLATEDAELPPFDEDAEQYDEQ